MDQAHTNLHPAPETYNVLLVDDDEDQRLFFELLLQEAGYSVIAACSAEEGLIKIKEEQIDVIVSDLRMPQVDGMEFLNQLAAWERDSGRSHTPVVILSAGDSEEAAAAAMAVGADSFCAKRDAKNLLFQRLKVLLPG
ncbi:response regulator [Oligoflexia bacterium]|nr:response regulator [Oligoflexia bacterium]